MAKLAIVTTHPVQYYAPLFKLLSKEISLKVFYTWGEQSISKYDPGFKQVIEWDVPLLDGYDFEFLINTSKDPGSHHFKGIINPYATIRISDFKPDAILIFGWSYVSHLKIIRHFKSKVPIWFRGDSTLLDEKAGLKSFAKHFFLRWVYSHIDKVFYVGSNNKKYFEKFGLKKVQMVFAPHAIDNDRFLKNHQIEANKIRESLGIAANEILILYAGKFEDKKDPVLLLEAFMELKSNHTHLLFVGNGVLEHKLKALSVELPEFGDSQLHLRNRIHFMDFQNQQQMPVIYQTCNLFCLPSKGPGETWGLAVNEAMAAGKAILISDKVGCGTDLVQPRFNGDIFLSENKNDLIHKLSNLLHLELLNKYGLNSATHIKNWSLKHSLKSIIKELGILN